MVIDVHTHVYPDKIAARTVALLQSVENHPVYSDGTLKGLKEAMAHSGVDLSVVLPVMTKPSQFESILSFAVEVNNTPGFCSYGGIHPECTDIEEKLDRIQEAGLRGVKLHPDYQGAMIDHPGYKKILLGCRKRGLAVTIHCGKDPAYPDCIHCPPDKSAAVLAELFGWHKGGDFSKEEPFINLAHMGGLGQYDLVEKYLVGLPVYLDLAFMLETIEQTQLLTMIRSHGADKILFASDSPWQDQRRYIDLLESFPLTEEEKAQILYKNASKLLKLS